jgi:transcriptional regulator with XRE-family HTH domain
MSTREAYQAELDQLLEGFAANLRRLRGQKRPGYSQGELSRDADLHRTAVGNLEQGKREPRLSTLLILADVLGVTLNDLVAGLPVPQERRPSPQAKHETSSTS